MRSRRATLWVWASLLAASILLLWLSWGRWSDAIVDSGREWIVPDGLARGEMLYRDVVYWFGPLTPYFVAGLFRLFGSGFTTLVAAGCLTAIASIVALDFALRRVTGKWEAVVWSTVAVPALVFMPWAGGAVFGMGLRIWQAAALTLFAVSLAIRRPRAPARAAGIGALCGLAGLCRVEWGVAALAACGLAIVVRLGVRRAIRSGLMLSATWAAVFGGVTLLFVSFAGSKAVLGDSHVLLAGLPEETQKFLFHASGLHDVPGGILRMIRSAALWTCGWLALAMFAVRGRDSSWLSARLPILGGALAITFLYRSWAGPWPMFLFSAAPLAGAAAAAVGLARRGPRGAALAAFGSLAFVLSYRKPFSITDWPYVAPPLLFAIVAAAALLRLSVTRANPSARRVLSRAAVAGVAVLSFAFFVGRIAWYRHDTRVPVPGTAAILRADRARAAWLAGAASEIGRVTRSDEALVVFPEGELLNYLAGRHNPLRHRLYLPGYLTASNETEVLAELRQALPGAIAVLNRPTREYGLARFGEDYGREIQSWISEHYRERLVRPTESGDRLFFRRATEGRDPPANPVP
jgi:hypothetical protein